MSARYDYRHEWHKYRANYLRGLRLKLEAMLGSCCSYCGASRADGVNLQFHHHLGRAYDPRKLSWGTRLHRYHAEIKAGSLLYLACDQSGQNCHERRKRTAPSQPQRLYDYDHDSGLDPCPDNQPF